MGSSFALPRPGSWRRSGACPFEASTGSPDRRPICPSSGRLQAMRRGTTPRRAMSALVAVGCVAGLGAGVAGCSGDPGPTTTTTTVTEEPSPSPMPAVSSTEVTPGQWWSVDVDLVQDPSQTLDSQGELVEDFPETIAYHMDLAVIREDGIWLVREVSHAQTG